MAWTDRHAAAIRASSLRSAVDVAAEPGGQAVGDDLDDPAEGVVGGVRRVDAGDHPRLGVGVEHADGRGVDAVEVVGAGARPVVGEPFPADFDDVATRR
jgi:hypothetical protein